MNISDSATRLLSTGSSDLEFYGRFLGSYPEFQEFFRDTDMNRQSNLLISTMVMVEAHYAKENEGFAAYLRHLGADHQKLGITREDYAKWTAAMLSSLQDFHGADWSDKLKHQWEAAIENAITDILSGYAST